MQAATKDATARGQGPSLQGIEWSHDNPEEADGSACMQQPARGSVQAPCTFCQERNQLPSVGRTDLSSSVRIPQLKAVNVHRA
eukprot:365381-Chlamydomonas_euryale.AAC.18